VELRLAREKSGLRLDWLEVIVRGGEGHGAGSYILDEKKNQPKKKQTHKKKKKKKKKKKNPKKTKKNPSPRPHEKPKKQKRDSKQTKKLKRTTTPHQQTPHQKHNPPPTKHNPKQKIEGYRFESKFLGRAATDVFQTLLADPHTKAHPSPEKKPKTQQPTTSLESRRATRLVCNSDFKGGR